MGKVRFAKAWESAGQGAIGYPPDSQPPTGVDYDRWLGPAPQRPFNPRRFHGSWRWFFDYGTGDLGNDGVHRLDVARWALETAIAAQKEQVPGLPAAVSAHGGKYYFDDAQEWPDTLMVTYDYPEAHCVLTYEMRIWTPYPLHEEAEGAAVCGDNGSVVIGNSRWRAFDRKGQPISESRGGDNTVGHVRNFLDCMRQPEQAKRGPGDGRASVQHALPPGKCRLAGRPDTAFRSADMYVRRRCRGQSLADAAGVPEALGAAQDRGTVSPTQHGRVGQVFAAHRRGFGGDPAHREDLAHAAWS